MKYGLLITFLCLVNLVVTAQETDTPQLCDQIQDGEANVMCAQFHQALGAGNYLSPATVSAYDLLLKLEQMDLEPGFVLAMRIKLTSALQGELSQVLEVAAHLPMEQTATELIYGRDFSEYCAFAEKVGILLGSAGEENITAQWQQRYFAGLEMREKARRLQSRDTSLLMPIIRTQLEGLKSGVDIPQLNLEIASLLFDIKSYNQSRNFFLKANKLAPDWGTPLIGLSQYVARFEEEQAALKLASRAIAVQTGFAQSYLNAARLYAKFEQPLKSVEYFRLAIDQVITDLQTGPSEFRLYTALTLSELLLQFELYEQAETFLKKILAKRAVPEAYLLLGEIYEYTNRTLSADSVYRQCIGRWPDYTSAYTRGGMLYQGLGRNALAKPFFEEAYTLNPKDREACFNLGGIRHLYNLPGEAELLYQQALAYPEGLAFVFNTMDTMARKIDEDDSKEQMKFLAALNDPESFFKSKFVFSGPPISAYEDFIYANLGDLLYEQGRLKEAIVMYRHALLLNPGLSEVYKSIVQAFYDVEDLKSAFTYIKLYQLYVPYSRESKGDWKVMGQLARELSKAKVPIPSIDIQNVYTFYMDNLWTYLYSLHREDKRPNLERTAMLRQQRPILQALKKIDLEEVFK